MAKIIAEEETGNTPETTKTMDTDIPIQVKKVSDQNSARPSMASLSDLPKIGKESVTAEQLADIKDLQEGMAKIIAEEETGKTNSLQKVEEKDEKITEEIEKKIDITPEDHAQDSEIDEITEEYLFGKEPEQEIESESDSEKIEEQINQAAQAVENQLKIDPARKQVFEGFKNVLETADENKLEAANQYLQAPGAAATVNNDTSLGIFAGIVSEVHAQENSDPQNRVDFVNELTEQFGYLGQDVADPNDKDAENLNIAKTLSAIQAVTAENEKFAPFAEKVTANFQGAFSQAVDLLKAVDPNEAKSFVDGKVEELKAQQNSEQRQSTQQQNVAPISPATQQQDQIQDLTNPQPQNISENQQNQQSGDNQNKEESRKKGASKNILDDLGPKDFAKAGLSIAAIVALSVVFPGVGTLVGLAIAGAVYSMGKTEEQGSRQENENHKKELESVLKNISKSAILKGEEVLKGSANEPSNVKESTEEFCNDSNEEMEEQKSKLSANQKALAAANQPEAKVDEHSILQNQTQEETVVQAPNEKEMPVNNHEIDLEEEIEEEPKKEVNEDVVEEHEQREEASTLPLDPKIAAMEAVSGLKSSVVSGGNSAATNIAPTQEIFEKNKENQNSNIRAS